MNSISSNDNLILLSLLLNSLAYVLVYVCKIKTGAKEVHMNGQIYSFFLTLRDKRRIRKAITTLQNSDTYEMCVGASLSVKDLHSIVLGFKAAHPELYVNLEVLEHDS